ncbi:MAG: DUF1232 domain-containing protein [Planctomycetes bacterium]|nr:DUF1232 domain-containing protein [Planctomycetota bacterium]
MNNKAKAALVIVLTVVYLLSPIDLVPDFLPGVGQLDDLAALLFGGKKALGLLFKGPADC